MFEDDLLSNRFSLLPEDFAGQADSGIGAYLAIRTLELEYVNRFIDVMSMDQTPHVLDERGLDRVNDGIVRH